MSNYLVERGARRRTFPKIASTLYNRLFGKREVRIAPESRRSSNKTQHSPVSKRSPLAILTKKSKTKSRKPASQVIPAKDSIPFSNIGFGGRTKKRRA